MIEESNTPKTVRVITLIVIVAIILLAVGLMRLLTWSFAPNQVLIVRNTPVPVQPPEVKDGGKIYLNIDYCKEVTAVGKTEVNLIGESAGAKIAVAWPDDESKAQCSVLNDVPVPIPAQTPTDTYHVEFVVCYDINPVKRNRCTTFTSQHFKVLNDKLNPGDAEPVMEPTVEHHRQQN